MTFNELIDQIELKLTRAGSNRLSAADIREVALAMAFYFQGEVGNILPDWTNAQSFSIDGSGDGAYCKYPDTNGKKRLFETKIDNNINQPPPSNPAVTENAAWREVSASAAAAIPEWQPGVYPPGLVIVFHNHSTDNRNLYVLTEPVRPYTSANIETELVANKWQKLGVDNLTSVLAKGASAGNQRITNLADPVSAQDADNKQSRDAAITTAINALKGGVAVDGDTLNKLNSKIAAINAIIGSGVTDGDTLVNTVTELLAIFQTYSEGVDILNLISSKVNVTDVYNALDQAASGKVLDARQGKALKDLIDALTTIVNSKLTGTLANDAETQITGAVAEDNKFISRLKLFNWWTWIRTQSATFNSWLKAKQLGGDYAVLVDAATIAWDGNVVGNTAMVTLAGNRTLGAITNPQVGFRYTLRVVQDATGGRTLAFNAAYTFPNGLTPILNSGAGNITLFEWFWDGANFRYLQRNGSERFLDVFLQNQVASGSNQRPLFIDSTGKLQKSQFINLDETNKKITKTGKDTLGSTIEEWLDSNSEKIFEILSDKSAKFYGTSSFWEVNAGIASGSAGIRFLSNLAIAYRLQDAGLNDYLRVQSITGDRRLILTQPVDFNFGVGLNRMVRQYPFTTDNTNGAWTTVFEFTLSDNEHYQIIILSADATATDGVSISPLDMHQADVRKQPTFNIEGGSLPAMGTISANTNRIPSATITTGGFRWNLDTVNQKIQFQFQNTASGNRTFDGLVEAAIVKRVTPV